MLGVTVGLRSLGFGGPGLGFRGIGFSFYISTWACIRNVTHNKSRFSESANSVACCRELVDGSTLA